MSSRSQEKNGCKLRDRYFWLQLMKTENAAEPAKIGIIASRRFGERYREVGQKKDPGDFRRKQNRFPSGVNLVALPRPGISEASFPSLEKRFVEAVEKLSS